MTKSLNGRMNARVNWIKAKDGAGLGGIVNARITQMTPEP